MNRTRRAFLEWIGRGAAVAGLAPACGGRAAPPLDDTTATDSGGGEQPAQDNPEAADACAPTTADVQGPYFENGAPQRTALAAADEPGERLEITGRVVDERCAALAGALLDIWQADAQGNYHGGTADDYRLRGRVLTDAQGGYAFTTIMPGNYRLATGWRPAHIHFTVSRPGFAPLTTQLYFAGDANLPPHDACGSGCRSDDPQRIIDLDSVEQGPKRGSFEIVLTPTAGKRATTGDGRFG